MATTSMEDILSDKPAEKVKEDAPPAETAVAEAPPAEKPQREERSIRRAHQRKEWEAQGRDPETGQFIPKPKDEEKAPEKKTEAKTEAKPEAKPTEAVPAEAKPTEAKPAEKPAQTPFTDRERALLRAAEDERRKRQALEAERAKWVAGAQPAPAEGKKFWDDPEAALAAHEQKVQQTVIQTRLQTAEMLARSRYKDFDDKIAKFSQLVQQNPALAQQWIASADPGEFAYQTARGVLEIEQAGSVEKLLAEREAKARAEERAKVEAEFKTKQEELERQRQALPGTLSDVRGAATRPAQAVFHGPTPMADILKH